MRTICTHRLTRICQHAQVLHGADSDIVWLQRDFGIYVVNMFDTGQAARVLGMASFFPSSLSLPRSLPLTLIPHVGVRDVHAGDW